MCSRMVLEKLRSRWPPRAISNCRMEVGMPNGARAMCYEKVKLKIHELSWPRGAWDGLACQEVTFLVMEMRDLELVLGWDMITGSRLVFSSLLKLIAMQGHMRVSEPEYIMDPFTGSAISSATEDTEAPDAPGPRMVKVMLDESVYYYNEWLSKVEESDLQELDHVRNEGLHVATQNYCWMMRSIGHFPSWIDQPRVPRDS